VSAGEKQLVTIARALLANRPLLVLDEATSAVDADTEELVRRGLAQLRAGRTSLVIAHRLDTVRDADLIAVLEGGRIVECGRYDELCRAGGAFAALHAARLTA
jgi:ATP-binding cassette subfamily B protein